MQISTNIQEQAKQYLNLKDQVSGLMPLTAKIEELEGKCASTFENINQKMQRLGDSQVQQRGQVTEGPMLNQVVVQINNLGQSLKNFELENIRKIEAEQKSVQTLQGDVDKLRAEVKAGNARLEEGESSFLSSFQDIKSIVLGKLQALDKQIEFKEEQKALQMKLDAL